MGKILLGHGSGGRLMHQLIREHLVPAFDLMELGDSAVIELTPDVIAKDGVFLLNQRGAGDRGDFIDSGQPHNDKRGGVRLAFTTDSYVVSPIFFPGGNIGELAVNGTVNDLSMVGAKPLCLSAGFILEEGFPMDDLKTILSSMASASQKANVKIITGDTKVVDKGKGDGIFINTTGIGIIPNNIDLGPQKIKAGDKIIISGLTGSHGIAVLAKRHGVSLEPPILSDTLPLNGLVEVMLSITEDIRMMRDPTRGGIATTLKEIASDSGLCLTIHEDLLPISPGVIGACELLGLDHLYVANEGILIAVVPGNPPGNPDNVSGNTADRLLEGMRAHPAGRNAAIIGEVTDGDTRTRGMVLLKTAIGGTRVIDMLTGEQLPRIC